MTDEAYSQKVQKWYDERTTIQSKNEDSITSSERQHPKIYKSKGLKVKYLNEDSKAETFEDPDLLLVDNEDQNIEDYLRIEEDKIILMGEDIRTH